MSNTNDAKFSVAKLNDSNYQPWKFKLRMLMIREGTWNVISEVKPEPQPAEWIAKDEKAQTTISLSIEDSQIVHICKCTNAQDMWLELQKVHERGNLSNKLYLLRKLYQTKLGKGMDMLEYIRNTLEMVERLRGIGEDIKEFHVAALLLGGLPEEYHALVTALDARPDDELTLEYVKGKLVDEYKRKTETSAEATGSESALKVQTKFNKGKVYKNETRETRECFVCKKTGHLKKDCRVWKNKMREFDKQSGDHKAKTAVNREESNSNQEVCFKINTNESLSKGWFIDSGATSHMTNDRNFYTSFRETNSERILIANGQFMSSEGVGEGYLHCMVTPTQTTKVLVKDVLYAPHLQDSLLSVRKLTSQGNTVMFKDDSCIIKKGDITLATGKIENELFRLTCKEKANLAKQDHHHNCVHLWHRRLGHRDPEIVKKIENEVTGVKIDQCGSIMKCTSCIKGKLTKKSFPSVSSSRAEQPLDLIHSDVCGPMKTQTPGQKRYFLTFIDDHSRYTKVYLLHTKDEVSEKLEEYVAVVINKFGRKPKALRSDNGGEYTGRKTQEILTRNGIEFQTTVPYSPQQNGIAERKNRTLTESARCMLLDADLPNKYWGEAIMTACHLQNRLPSKATERTPYELWNGHKPDLNYLRIFGSKAFAYVPKEKRSKWDSRAQEGIFVGYSETSKGYRILDPTTNKITISRTVVFDEDTKESFKFVKAVDKWNSQEQIHGFDAPITEKEICDESQDEEREKEPIRQSTRINKGVPPDRLSYLVRAEVQSEPESWDDMLKKSEYEKHKWTQAAKEEMKSLEENQTWVLTELPSEKQAIGNKWVFKTKFDSEGKAQRHKARLVAKGYSQKYGIDYESTFAPVVKQSTLRILLSIAASKRLIVRHFDIKTAFLNGDIEEDLYMLQPEGFEKKGDEHLVCKLKKSIYGLKQSARAWNIKMNNILLENGFQRSQADQCLYAKLEGVKWMYILLYVDDLLIAHESEKEIKSFGKRLNQHFETKDLGNAVYYLGIQIEREQDGSFLLNQSAKIQSILDSFGMNEAKGASTPMDIEYLKLNEEDYLPNNDSYRQAVGALLYISTTTRPDIATAIGMLCRCVSKPRKTDWEAVKRVMRYLKQTISMKLKLAASDNLALIGYVDADWAGDWKDRKSTSGYLFKLGESPISWCSRKQVTVALSSTEAEYVSAAHASQEVISLRQLLQDFGLCISDATVLYEDNQGCIKLATNERNSARTKHIDVRHHHLRNLVENNVIKFVYCESDNMIADALTKPLPRMKMERLRPQMGLVQ